MMTHSESRRLHAGMTLVELLMALAIFCILIVAVASMLFSADNVNRYSTSQSTTLWEIESASRRIAANGRCSISASAVSPSPTGMTPTVSTDSNGQAHLTFIVPNSNKTTYTASSYTIQYYCVGTSAPFRLVESDPRYTIPAVLNVIAHNVKSFSASVDSSTTMKIWTDLQITPPNGWTMERHSCVQCRNY